MNKKMKQNNIMTHILLLSMCMLSLQGRSQQLHKVNLSGIIYLDMPFEQVDFDNEDVFYEIACSESDLNNDGLNDMILYLDFSDSKFEDVASEEKLKKETLICLQEASGSYRVTSHGLRVLYYFDKSKVQCGKGGFLIITEGDRYDFYDYGMSFTYQDDGFYMNRKLVYADDGSTVEDVEITDKSVPLEGFEILDFFYDPYIKKRNAWAEERLK